MSASQEKFLKAGRPSREDKRRWHDLAPGLVDQATDFVGEGLPGKMVSKREIAAYFKASDNTVDQWVRDFGGFTVRITKAGENEVWVPVERFVREFLLAYGEEEPTGDTGESPESDPAWAEVVRMLSALNAKLERGDEMAERGYDAMIRAMDFLSDRKAERP